MPSALVIYASSHGHTGRIATRIGEVLHEHDVVARVVDVHKSAGLDLAQFDLVVVGASVHAGHHQKEMVDWALLAAQNLRDTVEDMLKVRMMEESQLELHRRKIKVRRLAEQAADSLRGDAEARHLELKIGGEDIEVDADETLLRRAVENLLANGLRYTRMGTGVDVTIRTCPDNGVGIEVADRGPGIADPLKATLFEKYSSVEARSGQARRGNGLGLYLVRLTAEAHGGSVAALDRPGGGTIFRITLPAAA